MLSKMICAMKIRLILENVMLKVETDRQNKDGLMKTKLCRSTTCTIFPLVETIKLEVT